MVVVGSNTQSCLQFYTISNLGTFQKEHDIVSLLVSGYSYSAQFIIRYICSIYVVVGVCVVVHVCVCSISAVVSVVYVVYL